MSMMLISTTTIGAGGNTGLVFNSIPNTFTDLMLVISARSASSPFSFGYNNVQLKINGANSNFTSKNLVNDNGTTASYGETKIRLDVQSAQNTSNTFSSTSIYISNYTLGANKQITIEHSFGSNGGYHQAQLNTGVWSSASSVSSIEYYCLDVNLVQYSTASLYGITKGSGGATVS